MERGERSSGYRASPQVDLTTSSPGEPGETRGDAQRGRTPTALSYFLVCRKPKQYGIHWGRKYELGKRRAVIATVRFSIFLYVFIYTILKGSLIKGNSLIHVGKELMILWFSREINASIRPLCDQMGDKV